MAINVYWTCFEDEWVRCEEPTPLFNTFRNLEFYKDEGTDVKSCPAIIDYFKNIFEVKSMYNYELNYDEDNVTSPMYDQNFFDKHVKIRLPKMKFHSFFQRQIFFTDENSLLLSMENACFSDSEFATKTNLVPGIFDIGKWYRNLDFAHVVKKEFNRIVFKENDTLCYLKFHTNEKINFIEYKFNNNLNEFLIDNLNSRAYKKPKNLSYYYDLFKRRKMKDKILKEIKQNIL